MQSESRNKSIIAMKGHPFTGKTAFATQIASSLGCPVLHLDDFLDFLTPDRFPASPPSSTCTSYPQDLALSIICQIARSNLSQGLVREIIIDSPLSSRAHLDQLIELASSLEQTRLLVVECKPDNTYALQTRFENYSSRDLGNTQHKWYKCMTWEDVEKAIRNGYDERSDGYKVPKLLLDSLSDYRNYGPRDAPYIEAVKYMITRNEDEGPSLVVYNQWRLRQHLLPYIGSGVENREQFASCRGGSGHYITKYAEEGLGYETKCMVCQNHVMGAAYSCEFCSFTLHKKCAELLDDDNSKPFGYPPPDDHLLWKGCRFVYPELSFRCTSCEKKVDVDLDPDSSCGDCIFTTHLKSGRMPTVIRHECDEHFLSVVFAEFNPYEENCQCKACGRSVRSIWYSCKICGLAYHYRCLTEVAVKVEHVHGGHHHHMLLRYSSEEAEDYMCDVCFENEAPERRDPSRWFYSCQECLYVAHLNCVDDRRKTFLVDGSGG